MIKVNVIMTTFNIEKYVEKSIKSVLDQETEYAFNLIIVDDCSTDGTIAIIENSISSHPKGNLIELHKNSVNLGVVKNSRKILSLAKAPYVAMIDGDDYWIDNLKLQKQIGFLENNHEFNSSAGIVKKLIEETGEIKIFRDGWNHEKKDEYMLRDYLVGPFSQTSSYVYRNNFTFPEWFNNLQSNDATIFILATNTGKIKYFKDEFSVYRVRKNNYSSNKKAKKSNEKTAYFLNQIDSHFNNKYHKTINIRRLINNVYYNFMDEKNKISQLVGKALVLSLFLINKYMIKN